MEGVMFKKILYLIFISHSFHVFSLPLRSGEYLRVRIDKQFVVKASQQTIPKAFIKNMGEGYFLLNGDHAQLSAIYSKIYPNYRYYGDYFDSPTMLPNDTYFSKQFHHSIIETLEAWQVTQGDESVVVAVTDNEFQLDHKDLKHCWWKNQNEIAANGLDDDQNGYVDDIYGWDFIANDNNVDSMEDPTHGTHVTGIICALENNLYGGVGIAPKVKIMPLRWYGAEAEWTSAIIAETYNYAINNGAKIISTSYNIDYLVDDELYRDIIRDVRAKGVLIFNSAGNSNKLDPPRQTIEEITLVCSLTSSLSSHDFKSSFSNYGAGIDICAPGDPIFSTVQTAYGTQDRYAELSGTSMATPVAAAAAALIWSSHPNFSDKDVLDKLYQSADDIDGKNKKYKGLLGHGRVNVKRAVE